MYCMLFVVVLHATNVSEDYHLVYLTSSLVSNSTHCEAFSLTPSD